MNLLCRKTAIWINVYDGRQNGVAWRCWSVSWWVQNTEYAWYHNELQFEAITRCLHLSSTSFAVPFRFGARDTAREIRLRFFAAFAMKWIIRSLHAYFRTVIAGGAHCTFHSFYSIHHRLLCARVSASAKQTDAMNEITTISCQKLNFICLP